METVTVLWHPDALVLLLAAPCIGSFLGVVAQRLPAGLPWAWARSACPHCGRTLAARDLVPLLSWLISRGRCRHCGAGIAWRYPLIELAALGVAVWSLAVLPGWLAWAGAGLGWTLLTLSLIDLEHLILPDALTLPLIPAGLLVAWLVAGDKLLPHLLGAVLGFAFLALVRWLYFRWRGREGLGLGDAVLLAAAGAWVSWQGLASVILLAAAAALLVQVLAWLRGRGPAPGQELPFGPYLAAGFWLVWLYGPITLG